MDEDVTGGFYSEPKTLTAAQRKKLKKKQQALEQETEREVERASAPDLRLAEEVDINKQLEEVNKKIFKILGDGNCLFRAIEHQLVSANQRGSRLPLYDHGELRHRTVQHLLKHKDEYQAFVTASGEDQGDECYYQHYCNKMAQDGEWGGEVEILALSALLGCKIVIYEQGSKPKEYGNDNNGTKLYITFHKRAYALGGHYNSTT